jgi:cytochrome c biogenesis protein CcdA
MRQLPLRSGNEGMPDGRIRYWLLAAGLVLAAIAGYLGYLAYPRFELPAGIGAGFLVLAAGAGVASFFSPCSFPLLVTLLTRETPSRGKRWVSALGVAVPLSIGAVIFVLGVGALIALGGRSFTGSITFTSTAGRALRIAVGTGLVALGLVQSEIVPVSFHRLGDRVARPILQAQARLRRRNPRAGLILFGFGYLLAGFG